MRLTGKKALITGAGGGIGRAAALAFAREGAAVACCDIRQEPTEATAEAVRAAGGTAVPVIADLTAEDAAREGVEAAERQLGGLNAVFNNAGLVHPGDHGATDTPLAAWEATLAVNLTGSFLCARAAARVMLRRRAGAIINISSIMGHSGGGLYPNPAYHASKGGIVNLTRALAAEWGDRGIRVNDIAPTFVDTPLATPVLGDPAMRAEIERLHPLGRVARVDDLAGAILYLASPASALVTGQSLAVDGGWLAR